VPDDEASFYDLLAIARLRWLDRMRGGLAERGFTDFRRGDGAWIRILGAEPHGPEPCGPAEIADAIGISRQAATKMADSLEQRGYLERRGDEHDRRRVALHLTEKGRRYHDATVEVVTGLNESFRASISAGDLEAAIRVLHVAIGDPAPE
jgi:DNA-binding MarR family transcriptional regulator